MVFFGILYKTDCASWIERQRLSLKELCYQQNKLKSSDEVRAVLSDFRGIYLFKNCGRVDVKRYTAQRR